MRKPSKKTSKNKLDKLVSEIVRSKKVCIRCGSRRIEILQPCHIFSRKNLSVRWDFDNVLCMCAGCHWWAHLNPILFTEFVFKLKGETGYNLLKQKAATIKKWTIGELQELYEQLLKIRSSNGKKT